MGKTYHANPVCRALQVDAGVILVMNDEQLREYLPRWGDCIAVRAFARQLSSPSDGASTCRSDLVDKLRMTLDAKRQCRSRKSLAIGNKRAEKKERRVEIGWKLFDATGHGTQIRSQNGGGTRQCTVDKCTTVSQLVTMATDLFYPDGVSPKGKVPDFQFDLQDFAGRLLSLDKTVGALYDESRVRLLRVYLCAHPVSAEYDTAEQVWQEQTQCFVKCRRTVHQSCCCQV